MRFATRLSRRSFQATVVLTLLGGATAALQAQANLGQAAPPLVAKDLAGKTVQLSDFKGKTVVLEWINPSCPFVKKHYGSGNIPGQQRAATADGVVWLSVASTASSHREYLEPAALAAWVKEQQAAPTAVLMDSEGTVGRAWGAKTTPHLFVVNAEGQLVYAGAIDSIPSANPADVAKATQHVPPVLQALKAGAAVAKPSSAPYGCSVKYAG